MWLWAVAVAACRDVSDLCKAKFLSEVGKKTEVFGRWSTVTGESGFADTARDPRGFSIKFYTEEGNWDMVGNNTPVFFIRDGIKFPDLIHSQKRNPQTHMKDPNAFWDFLSLVPESLHQVYPCMYRILSLWSLFTIDAFGISMGGFFGVLLWIEQQRIECCFYHEGVIRIRQSFWFIDIISCTLLVVG